MRNDELLVRYEMPQRVVFWIESSVDCSYLRTYIADRMASVVQKLYFSMERELEKLR